MGLFKEQLQPVIGPMKAMVDKIKAIIPLDAIRDLRKTVHDRLHHASQMVTSMRNPKGVTENQEELRGQIRRRSRPLSSVLAARSPALEAG